MKHPLRKIRTGEWVRPVRKGYLGDPATIAVAAEVVRKQTEKR